MRSATVSDVPAIRALFTHAYVDDPLMRWIFPDDATRLESVAAWLGVYVERYLTSTGAAPRARVVADGDAVVAAALWRWPDDNLDLPGMLPTVGGLLGALIGPDHTGTVAAGMSAARELRPTTPHAYLHFLAVDVAQRGRGVARSLVEDGVSRAAADGLPTVLETTRSENVTVYRCLGFDVLGETALGEGPVLWTMGR